MPAGRVWPAEWTEYEDLASGARVRQLTNYLGHSHHLYFTNPGWYDDGRRLLAGSDRENAANLFSVDLETGEITQITDLPQAPETRFLRTYVNPLRPEAYFFRGPQLLGVDLKTFESRLLWRAPQGFRTSMLSATADGRYVCLSVFEDLSDRIRTYGMYAYAGFRETFEAHPLSRVVRVAVDSGDAETVWEERCWIAHVNASPSQAHLLMFCHEGPWPKVDNRIWGLNHETGVAWQIRPREGEESPGHEYWLDDGERVAYHGGYPDGRFFFGCIRYDNAGRVETTTDGATGHMHSNDFSLIVGDGGGVVRIWRRDGETFDGPRVLCEHRSSFNVQRVHAHPRFSPDGRQVLFTSDRTGYGNVYLVDVPDFDSLPPVQRS
jgi:oligogalacturonide lyase